MDQRRRALPELMLVVAVSVAAGAAIDPGASGTSPWGGQDAPDVRVALGTPEVVMDYSSMSCRRAGGLDLPDVQARAMRRPDGSLLLVSGNAPVNFSLTGPDFDHLTRDCAPLLVSGDSPVASTFDNQEWLLSVFRDADNVHGLVHNEYHDPAAPNCKPGVSDPSNPCWYNALTYASSVDGGHTFTQPPAPDNVVAALPYPWDPTVSPRGAPPPHGYFSPSNIVRGPDGAYYSMFMAISDRATSAQGQCVMRTEDLSDPSSWRAWDGSAFRLPMPSPYDADGNPAPTGREPCTPVSRDRIGGMGGSLTYNTYLRRYMLVGSGVFGLQGALVCGTWLSLSEDLLSWTAPELVMPGKLPHPPCDDGSPDGSLIYPSLIDHGDTDASFQNTGADPYLYFVRWNHNLDRDLMRVPVHFRVAEPREPTLTAVASATLATPVRRSATPTSAATARPPIYAPLVFGGVTAFATPTGTPRAPLEPPDGRTYHGVSPNPSDVDAYVAALGNSDIEPIVEGVHMGIPGTRPASFGANVQRTVDRITGAGRIPHLSFSFTIGDGQPVDRDIAESDRYDALIDEAARTVAAVGGPVFVRPGFEFNGSWNGYAAGVYPKAFRKLVDRFRAAGATNAVFIWCYEPDAPGDFADQVDGEALWYPGDDYVDWYGLDVFDASHFDPDAALSDRRGLTARGRSEAFLAMAREHGKPVYLSEVAAVKIGITADPADGEADWAAWFAKWFDFLDLHPEVKGFNVMPQDYTGTKYDQYGWGNARLQDNAVILARWIERLRDSRFIHRGR